MVATLQPFGAIMLGGGSTFRVDGYMDGWNGQLSSPPDVPVYASEYRDGYLQGIADAAYAAEYRRTHPDTVQP